MLQHRCFKNKYKITPGQSLVHHTWSSKEQLGRHSKKKHSVLCFVYILFLFFCISNLPYIFMTKYNLHLYVSTIVIAMILPSDEHNSITWQCSGKPVSLFRTETKINWKQIRCGKQRIHIFSNTFLNLLLCFCRLSAFHTHDFPSGTGLRNSHTYKTVMRNYRATLC